LPEAVADVARQWFQASDDDREHLMVLMLDAQNGLRLIHEVSIVTQSASLVPSREVFGPAPAKALRRSSFFTTTLLATQPRAAKIWGVTRQLADAGKLLHINVHDQVIVGSDTCQYMSLARQSAL
jgi:DNA repair protein RadC